MSISSIRHKKELLEIAQQYTQPADITASDHFSKNDLLLLWHKYAKKLEQKGRKIIASILQMNEPKLEGDMILMEVPNQTTFSSFEAEKNDLLTYLRNHLNNHIIFIEVIVNEEVANKNAYTDTDKLERLKSANPAIELLLKTFDLSY